MAKVPYVLNEQTLTFYLNFQPYAVPRDIGTWDEIVALLNSEEPDAELLVELASPIAMVASAIDEIGPDRLEPGTVSVSTGAVMFNGEVVHSHLAQRILDVLHAGFDIMPWVRFMENLYQNPSETSREELYLFLENSELPITSDGHFLAYKRVRDDFKDMHSGTFDNSIGQTVEMPRHKVDTDRDRTCSSGLHFCSKSYLPNFGSWREGHVVIVKINPADVVSIPSDYNNAKGRTWKYEVVAEVEEDEVTRGWSTPVYSAYDGADGEFSPLAVVADIKASEAEEAQNDLNLLADVMELGIVTLRRMASQAGMKGAWKGHTKAELAAFLANAA